MAYLGPSKPIFPPWAPLNFKTTSLSKSFLVSSVSALNVKIAQVNFVKSDRKRKKKKAIKFVLQLLFSLPSDEGAKLE